MVKNLQAVRGMRDILPAQSSSWQYIESCARDLFNSYGYNELRTPLIEPTELFKRGIGDATDIVEKEMYTFEDRNGDSLTLRPEGTAGCVRAAMQHGLLHNQQQRIWYIGPMFRHERPQKGRYRGFYQAGIETYGIATPDIDAEVIAIGARLWKKLGLKNVHLEINSLGSNQAREVYREILIEYFSQHQEQLDDDSSRRLHQNPLRILDTKNPKMKDLVKNAPDLLDYLDDESKEHFEDLKQRLDVIGIAYTVNSRLVRGLDYYNQTVFEWITSELGSQGTICAGGRYDNLVTKLGGKETPACGFGIGIDRLQLLLEEQNLVIPEHAPHLYLVMLGETAEVAGLNIAEELRDNIPHLRLMVNNGSGSFKAQLKRADKSLAGYALILGEDELENQQIIIKPLRQDTQEITQQASIALDKLNDYVANTILV